MLKALVVTMVSNCADIALVKHMNFVDISIANSLAEWFTGASSRTVI